MKYYIRARISNETILLSNNAEIPVGNSSVCIYVVAYDDDIAEHDESVLIIVRPVNALDTVNQNTTLLIIDDDGLYNNIAIIEDSSLKILFYL